jgi:NAD(P)-dependent dehydrogenase (short-subunit alcohol dehydrogenase family)
MDSFGLDRKRLGTPGRTSSRCPQAIRRRPYRMAWKSTRRPPRRGLQHHSDADGFRDPDHDPVGAFSSGPAQGAARFVILGSTAATAKPVLIMAAYSLGKTALEHTVRLLAPELARSGNHHQPRHASFVPTGMNGSKTNRFCSKRQRCRSANCVPRTTLRRQLSSSFPLALHLSVDRCSL